MCRPKGGKGTPRAGSGIAYGTAVFVDGQARHSAALLRASGGGVRGSIMNMTESTFRSFPEQFLELWDAPAQPPPESTSSTDHYPEGPRLL